MIPSTLPQEVSLLQAEFCAAFSDPTRVLILYALNDHPLNVTEISAELNITQPKTSRHLKILRDHGLVYTTRQATTITYHLSDTRLIQALDLLNDILRNNIQHRANLMNQSVFISD